MKIAISGSSGLIGSHLAAALRGSGHTVVPLVRRRAAEGEVSWDPEAGRLDAADLRGVDAVVNLSGAGIGDKRWSDAYRTELVDSRLKTTALLTDTIASLDDGPRILLSGSAIGYYGNSVDATFDESSPQGEGFLADLCGRWEDAAGPAVSAGCRVAYLRTGLVMDADGGILAKQLPLFKAGLGGRLGAGDQWLSWISIDDEVAAIVHLLESPVQGAVNLTAPEPVTNAEFTKTLGHVLGRPTVLRVPRFAPRIALGADRADNLLFGGQRVLPATLEADGFSFGDPTLEGALRRILGRS